MNKAELVEAIVERMELTKKDATRTVSVLFEAITDALMNGESVTIQGFGTFKAVERAARTGRNPQTGDSIEIPATIVPVFHASKVLKEAVK